MSESRIEAYRETLKTMLSHALILTERKDPYFYELGHYLADNLLAKVCICVAIEKNRKDEIYKINKKNYTKDLKKLYIDFLFKDYDVPDYDKEIKEYHNERNIYQHDVDSLNLTVRQEIAKKYVSIIEDIMRTVGIIGKSEKIYPTRLVSEHDYYSYEKKKNVEENQKFQEFYNLLKSIKLNNLFIKIGHLIEDISLRRIKRILEMEGIYRIRDHLHIWNDQWGLIVYKYDLKITKDTIKGISYSINKPNENSHVLSEFLDYFRKCCKNNGIKIKP